MYQSARGYDRQQPLGTPTRVRPEWARRLRTLHRGRVARQFALHFNINDYVVDLVGYERLGGDGQPELSVAPDVRDQWDKPPTFREYLHNLLFDSDHEKGFACQAIYTYTLANGMLASDHQRRGMGQPLTGELGGATSLVRGAMAGLRIGGAGPQAGQPAAGVEVNLPPDVPTNLKILGHMLRQRYMGTDPRGQQVEMPIAVVLDYCEKLIPYPVGEGQGTRDQLQALETVQSWALDPLIRETSNIIILLTTNRGQLAANVFGEGSGTRELRIPLPDLDTRLAFIRRKQAIRDPRLRLASLSPEFAPQTAHGQEMAPEEGLARATQGMRLMDIDGLNRETVMNWMDAHQETEAAPAFGPNGAVIGPLDVRAAKAEAIERQSAQLLEIVPPERGFNEIGGMVELKAYLSVRTELMARNTRSPLVPNGLLLAGPPGTGKTIIAEALAKEGRFNLVKMRNIQDRWVGSSERNLDMVLSLLKDLYPVVVFVDEIDQAMGRRDTGQSGDSGVSARMFARILEEMSKPSNRGQILWVAATNRTDILDDALLRRFDRVVPLLAPDAEESRRIFATMPAMIAKQSGGAITVRYGGDLEAPNEGQTLSDAELVRFAKAAERSAAQGLTGAEIEIVVRRAIEMAQEERIKAIQLVRLAADGLIAARQPADIASLSRRAREISDRNRAGKKGPALEPDVAGPLLDAAAVELVSGQQPPRSEALPPINSRHLHEAMNDFKINHDPTMYDYQSLLAIRSCNFYSILPKPLPDRPIFRRIVDAAGRVDPQRLDEAIEELARKLAPESWQRQAARDGDAGDGGAPAGPRYLV
jgi:SpoVK/Ycf46/Vps4 family AAA+-type ATPase